MNTPMNTPMNFSFLEGTDIAVILENIKSSKDFNYSQKILDVLSSCECCEQHSHSKPNFNNDWQDVTYSSCVYYKQKNCKCPCRHLSRQICRLCNQDSHFNKKQKIKHTLTIDKSYITPPTTPRITPQCTPPKIVRQNGFSRENTNYFQPLLLLQM